LAKLAVALPSPGWLDAAAAAGAELAELRLDLFEGEYDLPRLIEERPLPVIATLRPPREGGRCDAPDAERLRVLVEAARAGAEYVDLEWDAAAPAALDDLRAAGAGVIVSRHAFDRMPDLEGWAEQIARLGPDVVKVVGMAHDARECAAPLRVLARAERPTIAIAMGEAGLATRVLALRYERCFLTFAALPDGGTAPRSTAGWSSVRTGGWPRPDATRSRCRSRPPTRPRRSRRCASCRSRTGGSSTKAATRLLRFDDRTWLTAAALVSLHPLPLAAYPF
jgi:3-dehydroquinate dehydratase type I